MRDLMLSAIAALVMYAFVMIFWAHRRIDRIENPDDGEE